MLIENGAAEEAPTNDGITALFLACKSGHEHVVKLLLNTQAGRLCLNTVWPQTGATPLYEAVSLNDVRIVRLLLEYNETDVNAPDNDGFTPIYRASQDGISEVLKMLMQKNASVITPSNIGATPLFAAADQGHADIASLLLSTEEGQLTLNTAFPITATILLF